MILRNSHVAGTIGAEAFTKRQMNIDAYSFGRIRLRETAIHSTPPIFIGKLLRVPTRHRGITGVPRNGNIVLSNEVFKMSSLYHTASYSPGGVHGADWHQPAA